MWERGKERGREKGGGEAYKNNQFDTLHPQKRTLDNEIFALNYEMTFSATLTLWSESQGQLYT